MPLEILFKNDNFEWLDVQSPNTDDLNFLHEHYAINFLLLEDTIDPNHLPKYEADGEVQFYLTRENSEQERTNLNSISDVSTKLGIFVLGNRLITVHRLRNESIKETIKSVEKNIDAYTTEKIALELAIKVIKSFDDEGLKIQQTVDDLENEIFLKNGSQSNQIRRLYRIKRKTGLNTRILNLSADWVDKFKKLNLSDTEITDLQDKYKNVLTDFDHLNSQITNLISMHLALSDQKANQVMKLLAIYSMYFLPITFIAGLYGMNFEFMPELKYPFGYFAVLGLMLAIVVATFIYVKRKKW